MSAMFLHLLAGMLTGAFFRIQTLVVLAFLVLVETVGGLAGRGGMAAVLWAFGAELMLQLGYLAGIYARAVLERLPLAARTTGRASGSST